ncbi:MAG: TIGR03084 family metal-binding protein [Chloroflexi bacterium]|nr:TIGR03084 family metal-binding protein [Chloroflexota bacterium]MDA1147061.1 TIGR03084 family metal-binding protein [Chloroflexota bacterium]
MDELIADLVAEQDYLDAAIRDAPEARWNAPSPADGWLMRDCVAHLAELDRTAAIIAETGAYPDGDRRPGDGVVTAGQLDARRLSIAELLSFWRESRARLATALKPLDGRDRLPWAGNTMSVRSFTTARLMEAWSHGLDAIESAGVTPVDSDRLRNIAHIGYATRDFAYRNRGLEPSAEALRVELTAPSGAIWSWGPDDATARVTGTAGDFCRVVTQRIHYTDTGLEYTPGAAEEYLQIAQAFAGPTGAGRPPSGTPEGAR